jgi:hypothetical protein
MTCPNIEIFLEALRQYAQIGPNDAVPVVKIHGRGPGIDVKKTLALEEYDEFPDKESWIARFPQ